MLAHVEMLRPIVSRLVGTKPCIKNKFRGKTPGKVFVWNFCHSFLSTIRSVHHCSNGWLCQCQLRNLSFFLFSFSTYAFSPTSGVPRKLVYGIQPYLNPTILKFTNLHLFLFLLYPACHVFQFPILSQPSVSPSIKISWLTILHWEKRRWSN